MRLLACLYHGPVPPKFKRLTVDLLGELYVMNPPLHHIRPGLWIMWQGTPAVIAVSANGGPRQMVPVTSAR